MKILFICNEFPPTIHGGIGSFVFSLTHELVKKGINCYVIGFDQKVFRTTTNYENGVRVTRVKSPFVNFQGVKIGRFSIPPNYFLDRFYLSYQLEKLLEHENIDVMESYDWGGPIISKPRCPLVVRMHGANSAHQYFEGKKISEYTSFYERNNILFADKLVAVSRHIGNTTCKALKISANSFQVIYNGVDTDFFFPKGQRTKNSILFAGSVARRKGVYELFKAFNIIQKQRPDTELIISGKLLPGEDGTRQKNELLNLLEPLAQEKVAFLGHVPYQQMPEIYSKATIAIFPSHAEAFGLTCAEAMACETPVIMTKLASGPEIVDDNESGLLVDPFSSYQIADSILRLLDNPLLRKKLGENGRKQVVERFDQKMILDQNLLMYSGLVGKNER